MSSGAQNMSQLVENVAACFQDSLDKSLIRDVVAFMLDTSVDGATSVDKLVVAVVVVVVVVVVLVAAGDWVVALFMLAVVDTEQTHPSHSPSTQYVVGVIPKNTTGSALQLLSAGLNRSTDDNRLFC